MLRLNRLALLAALAVLASAQPGYQGGASPSGPAPPPIAPAPAGPAPGPAPIAPAPAGPAPAGPAPAGPAPAGPAPSGPAPAGPGGVPPRIVTAQYSCTKIPFKATCSTGFASQLVLRWYLKDGKCCSYPYGHCKGEDDTLTNAAIRTKADCESICIKGDKSQPGSPSGGGSSGGAGGAGGGNNAPSGGSGGSAPSGGPSGGAPPPSGGGGGGNGVPPRIVTAQYSCTKIPYKATCSTGFASQLVLRWYLKDGKCCSYPFGHCKGEDDTLTDPAIRTKADCEAICIKGEKGGPAGGGGGSGGSGGNSPGVAPGQPGNQSGGGGAPSGGVAPPPGGGGNGVPPRVVTAQYSCNKIPYKATCSTGFASQLVLRWYLKDGKCCSYPFGHCKGEDDTLTDPSIRTKADCESICKGGGSSNQPGGNQPGGKQPGGNQPGGNVPGGYVPGQNPGGQIPGGQIPGGENGKTQKPQVQVSCDKIPFKATCSTGFPSQLVLRWYLKDGKCCSYPFGHCKGEDDTTTSPSIRTKAECEASCGAKG